MKREYFVVLQDAENVCRAAATSIDVAPSASPRGYGGSRHPQAAGRRDGHRRARIGSSGRQGSHTGAPVTERATCWTPKRLTKKSDCFKQNELLTAQCPLSKASGVCI